MMPAAFWKRYRPELILKKSSDQGPWGGVRKVVWKCEKPDGFVAGELIDYAAQNGWPFVDSLRLVDGLPEMPAGGGDADCSLSLLRREAEAAGVTDCRVLRFRTGWIAVEPGNARDTETNGFLLLSADGTGLTMLHRWGE
jgi:hypothetical protein